MHTHNYEKKPASIPPPNHACTQTIKRISVQSSGQSSVRASKRSRSSLTPCWAVGRSSSRYLRVRHGRCIFSFAVIWSLLIHLWLTLLLAATVRRLGRCVVATAGLRRSAVTHVTGVSTICVCDVD